MLLRALSRQANSSVAELFFRRKRATPKRTPGSSCVHSPNMQHKDTQDEKQDPGWAEPHRRALQAGDKFYKDPDTGLMVMTEVIHLARGKCCGSGCRHCPYSHERVPAKKRAQVIQNPAWLLPPPWATKTPFDRKPKAENTAPTATEASAEAEHNTMSENGASRSGIANLKVIVLFWSTGKDSFLAYRALMRATAGTQTAEDPPIPVEVGTHVALLTTFDSDSRRIAHQDTGISDALNQAQALGAPLMGVPLPRGGDNREGAENTRVSTGGYVASVHSALAMIRKELKPLNGRLVGLAFGDLHLMHVRMWREAARLQSAEEALIFPLWRRSEEDMIREIETCGVPCVVSSVADEGEGVVFVGERFNRQLWERARKAGKDGFGENGEFHTLAKVWEAPHAKKDREALEW